MSKTTEVSKSEKRRFAEFPGWDQARAAPGAYTDALEAWYKDRFGFRQQLVYMHNFVHTQGLGHSPLTGIIVGERDWLFYNAQFALDDYQGRLQVPHDALERWTRTLQSRHDWLATQGIRYLFAVVPNKMTVYPEHLPKRYRRQLGPSVLEQFSAFLDERSGVPFFLDLSGALYREKQSPQAYFRTDSHWNSWGAYVGYREIGALIKQWFPDFRVIERDDLRTRRIDMIGGLANMLSLTDVYREPIMAAQVRQRCAARKARRIPGLGHSKKWSARENGCGSAQLTALMIHDSFGAYLQPYFSEGFAKIVYINYEDFNGSRKLIAAMRPDIVIELRVQRSLPLALVPNADLENNAKAVNIPSPSLIPR